MLFAGIESVQKLGRQVVPGGNEIGTADRDGAGQRAQRRKPAVHVNSFHGARLAQWMIAGADRIDLASCAVQSHRQTGRRVPA
jgi:hypothetical protein